LKTSVHYKADVIMLFGDLTGKAIVPIVKRESDWYSRPFGKTERYFTKEEVEKKIQEIREEGFYAIEMSESQAQECQQDEKKMEALFENVMCETMDRWLSMIEEQVPKGIKVIVSPGNDDHFAIDEVIKKHERVIYPLKKVVEIDDKYKLISCEWVNPTPWLTPRECSEEELVKKLDQEFSHVDSHENVLCNLHAPPFGTTLDIAPRLDKNLKPIAHFGNPEMESVGSKSVRDAIMKYKPLLGLHGHIHECSAHLYLGRTLCVNPGSDYRRGILRGYVVDLPSPENPKMECWRVEG